MADFQEGRLEARVTASLFFLSLSLAESASGLSDWRRRSSGRRSRGNPAGGKRAGEFVRARDGAAQHPEEDAAEGARAAAAHAGPGQRRQNHDPEEVQRGRDRHYFAHAGFQHQDAGASRVQAEHLGRGGPEVPALVLAQLLREHRRAHLGGGQCRPPAVGRLQAGAAEPSGGGALGRGHFAYLCQQAGPAGRPELQRHPGGFGPGQHSEPPLVHPRLQCLHRREPAGGRGLAAGRHLQPDIHGGLSGRRESVPPLPPVPPTPPVWLVTWTVCSPRWLWAWFSSWNGAWPSFQNPRCFLGSTAPAKGWSLGPGRATEDQRAGNWGLLTPSPLQGVGLKAY